MGNNSSSQCFYSGQVSSGVSLFRKLSEHLICYVVLFKIGIMAKKQQESFAVNFYSQKLASNPEMPRYNHLMAAITSERGQADVAEKYYRQALA